MRRFTLLAFALCFAVPDLALAQPAVISVSPASLDFGQVVLGQTSTLPITVTNTGTDPLFIDWMQFADNLGSVVRPTYPGYATQGNNQYYFYNSDFSALSPIVVLAGQSTQIPIVFDPAFFAPNFVGAINGTVWIYSQTPGVAPAQFTYSGESVAAPPPPSEPPPPSLGPSTSYTVTPSVLNFGIIVVGGSVTIPVTFTNTSPAGHDPLAVWGFDVSTLPSSDGFSVNVDDSFYGIGLGDNLLVFLAG